MDELTLKITGMSCGHCVGQVTKALTRLDGVQVHSVKVGEASSCMTRGKSFPRRLSWL
jgi:copper chaperone